MEPPKSQIDAENRNWLRDSLLRDSASSTVKIIFREGKEDGTAEIADRRRK
jgi:hypothetical protein